MENSLIRVERVRELCHAMQTTLPAERFSEGVISDLAKYLELVVKWNRVMNLVGPARWQEVLTTLAADSFYLTSFLESLPLPMEPECWDLGAGAGLPGVPLRMVWQRGAYIMVEAREKRALFLKTVLTACSLPGVHVFQGRAEAFMPKRPPADLVVSRAFLPWEKVLGLVQSFMSRGGHVVFLTLTAAPDVLPEGWTTTAQMRYFLADTGRYLWALRYDSYKES